MNSDNIKNEYDEENESNSLTEKQVAQSVKYLNSSFSAACDKYRENNKEQRIQSYVHFNLKSRNVIRDEKVDYTLYDAEVEFCYLIDEIQRGPRAFAANYIKEANILINSLN